jgi:hypothetical protein
LSVNQLKLFRYINLQRFYVNRGVCSKKITFRFINLVSSLRETEITASSWSKERVFLRQFHELLFWINKNAFLGNLTYFVLFLRII